MCVVLEPMTHNRKSALKTFLTRVPCRLVKPTTFFLNQFMTPSKKMKKNITFSLFCSRTRRVQLSVERRNYYGGTYNANNDDKAATQLGLRLSFSGNQTRVERVQIGVYRLVFSQT